MKESSIKVSINIDNGNIIEKRVAEALNNIIGARIEKFSSDEKELLYQSLLSEVEENREDHRKK